MDEHDNRRTFAGKAYADAVESHPFHTLLVRPATLALLPPLTGLAVLDAGCGTGWYSEALLARGARVTALDATPEMVAHTRERTGGAADVHLADLARPLPFAEASFDGVLSVMALHYLEDWRAPLREFARVLVPGGLLVLATHHPFLEFERSGERYFEIERRVRDHPDGTLLSYRRPLSESVTALRSAGFTVDALLEPRPDPRSRHLDPAAFDALDREPNLLLVRAFREPT